MHHVPSPRFSPAPLALAVAMALCASTLAQAQTTSPSKPVLISIAAQPLEAALNELSAATGTPIAFPSALVATKTAPAVKGTLTVQQALQQLLMGSGLAAQQEANGTIFIRAAGTNAPGAMLPTVNVTAQAERDGTSEGTDSYRARYTSTATGLSLSPRETPQTVSVVTRQQMDDFGMTTVDQALESVSGVFVYNQAGSNYYYSRGFEMQLQYDGVANPSGISNVYSPAIDAAFIDRVETLQGAAGLMTGAGNPGGTINLMRKRPTDTFQASAEVQLGSWNQKRAVADISSPLIDSGKIRGRLVAVAEDRDSFVDYTYLKRQGVYGVVDADLSPTTKLSASFQYQHDKSNGSLGVPMASDGSNLGLPRSTFLGDPSASTLYTYSLFSASLEQQLSSSWKAKASVQHSVQNQFNENYGFLGGEVDKTTGDGLEFYGGSDYKNSAKYDAVDLSVSGPVTLFGRSHELAFGFSGSNWKNPQYGSIYSFTGFPLNVYTFNPASLPVFTSPGTYSSPNTKRQTGVYAVGRFKLTDSLKAIAGLRASWYNASSAYSNSLGTSISSQQSESGVFTPYAGLTYDLNHEFTAYASYSSIFTPSTYKSTSGYLKPVVGNNYELGIKGELLEKRLNVAAAVFRLEQTNLAKLDSSIPYDATNACGGYCYTAADKVISQGVDLSSYGEIYPGWNLAASYTYVNSKYASGVNDGQRYMKDLPQHSLRFSINHRLPNTGLTLGASLRTQSRISQDEGAATIRQSGYTLIGLTAKYEINKKADVNFAVNNLFDKRYYTAVYSSLYMPYGTPRSFSTTLRLHF